MPGEEHMKAALQQYIDAFRNRDAEALISLFAEDAVIEDPVGTEPVRGLDAISDFYRAGVKVVTKMELSAPIRGSHANAAAMAFDFEMIWEGQHIRTSTIDVMEFNEAGKIVRMYAYWGPGDSHVLG